VRTVLLLPKMVTHLLALVTAVYSRFLFKSILGPPSKGRITAEKHLIAFARNVLIVYGVSVVVYGVITYIFYSWRYARARKSLKNYYGNLKKLNTLYNN
jgi:heme/copper-type cytochrome/quinol oxidase subunit 2